MRIKATDNTQRLKVIFIIIIIIIVIFSDQTNTYSDKQTDRQTDKFRIILDMRQPDKGEKRRRNAIFFVMHPLQMKKK